MRGCDTTTVALRHFNGLVATPSFSCVHLRLLAIAVHNKPDDRQGSRPLTCHGAIRVAQRPRSSAARRADGRTGGRKGPTPLPQRQYNSVGLLWFRRSTAFTCGRSELQFTTGPMTAKRVVL